MAPKQKKGAVTEAPAPVRDPQHNPSQAPESGPSGDQVVNVPATPPEPEAATPLARKEQKAQERLQAKAENVNVARSVKVRAVKRGFINRVIEADTVFVLALAEGEPLPTWVVAVDDSVVTSSLAHSSEAQPEVVGADGVGRKVDSNDVL